MTNLLNKNVQIWLGDKGQKTQQELDTPVVSQSYAGTIVIDPDTKIPTVKFKSGMNVEDYIYRYENTNNEIINSFEEFDYNTICHFNEYNIAPYLASHIGIYNKDTNERIGSIDISSFKPFYPPRIYRVGLVSDVHYNDYDDDINTEEDNSSYSTDLRNAMEMMYDKEGVAMMCCAGDIAHEGMGESLRTFSKCQRTFYPNKPFFTCKGNHDNGFDYNYNINNGVNNANVDESNWHKYTFPTASTLRQHPNIQDIEYCPSDCSSFCFYYVLPGGIKKDFYIFLSVDYGNGNTGANIRLQPDDGGLGNLQFYADETLKWFSNKMEENIDRRSFVFTHQFFWQKAGNNNNPAQYRYGQDPWRIQWDSSYCLYGRQFELLNSINNKCKNSIWFTGHSHYKWMMQRFDPYTKVCKKEWFLTSRDQEWPFTYRCESGATCGLPSLARPLDDSDGVTYYSVDEPGSECGIMDIYEDFVDIRGIKSVFRLSDELKIEKYLRADSFEWEWTSAYEYGTELIVNDLPDNYIEFIIDSRTHDIPGDRTLWYGTVGDNGEEMMDGSYVDIEYFKAYDFYGNDITENLRKSNFVGFRVEEWETRYTTYNHVLYYIDNSHMSSMIVSSTKNKFAFGLSGAYQLHHNEMPNDPNKADLFYSCEPYIRIVMKVKGIGVIKSNDGNLVKHYNNYYLPIAQYRLNIPAS